jgi:hypothetical protein
MYSPNPERLDQAGTTLRSAQHLDHSQTPEVHPPMGHPKAPGLKDSVHTPSHKSARKDS